MICDTICDMSSDVKRKAVPLSAAELAAVEAARTPGSEIHQALAELTGAEPGQSEASVLSALVGIGLGAVRQRATERGYAALAAELAADPEEAAVRAASRAGRRRREAARAEAGI